MLSQSQSQAHDLAEQMGQRLKVTEAMLAEAVKARERLVADNQSAVEGLLATINSKDQLLKVIKELHVIFILRRNNKVPVCLSLVMCSLCQSRKKNLPSPFHSVHLWRTCRTICILNFFAQQPLLNNV